MFLKVYQKLIIGNFLKLFINTTLIFLVLIIVLNIFEELNFFKDTKVNILYPIILTLLNAPSVLYEIFPFIFLITTQFLFIKLIENDELILFKSYGLNNLKLLTILTSVSFIMGICLIALFYNFSSKLKFIYFDIKNDFTEDNKYLAVITENGIWMKDEIENRINIIDAKEIDKNILIDININQFEKDTFNLVKTIYAKKADVRNKKWVLKDISVRKNNFDVEKYEELTFNSNFDIKKINGLFENLSSLTYWELKDLEKELKKLGYSTLEIKLHNQKIYSYPFFLAIMTLFSGIIMLNIKTSNRPKFIYILIGILVSVLTYYVNYFSGVLGQNAKIPIYTSVWTPIIFFMFISIIGMVRINEK